jgi:hypothetical protein
MASGSAPPTFEQSKDHILVNFSQSTFSYPGGEEPPPDFTPYQAEFSITDSGWIVSHDTHLNEDGKFISNTFTPVSERSVQAKLCIVFCCLKLQLHQLFSSTAQGVTAKHIRGTLTQRTTKGAVKLLPRPTMIPSLILIFL